MKETINKMLNHPFATICIIGAVTSGIASIIGAVKGNLNQPGLTITTEK